ncbi:MAG: EAL domain-containing protein, partial [Methylotenera sp.]|nr:EAL domain-containing protein [Methylotenera sp.]
QVLKMELVAEGVETQEQADCLLANNCPIVQGYLFGKPMPYAAFEALIESSDCQQFFAGSATYLQEGLVV